MARFHRVAAGCALGLVLPTALTFASFLTMCIRVEAQTREEIWSARQQADAAALSLSARLVDTALPDLPFTAWFATVVGDAKTYNGGPICQDIPYDSTWLADPTRAWNFCAETMATLSDGRMVTVALDASVVRDPSQPSVWKPISARFRAAYIIDTRPSRRRFDSLDVPNLSALKDALLLPVARWPHAELRIAADDIRVEPASFEPGDRVTVFVTVHNVGTESARVRLDVGGAPECSDLGFILAEVRGEIPAGRAVTLRSEVKVPDFPRWWLQASAMLLPLKQTIQKYEITQVAKQAVKPIGAAPFKKCSVG